MNRTPITLAIAGSLVALAAVLGALATAPPTTAMSSALLTGNLVQNPGAEDGKHIARFEDSDPGDVPSGWRFNTTSGAFFTQIAYDFDEAIGADERKKIESDLGSDLGDAFFAGGSAASNTTQMFQSIPILDPLIQAAIDAGTVQAKVSALIGGYGKEGDNGEVEFGFMINPATGSFVGKVALGPVTASDRKEQTSLLPRSQTVDVPKGTREIRVTLKAHFVTGVFVDAYFDNISLELVSKSSAPPPTTPTSPATTVPTPTAPATTAPTPTAPNPTAPATTAAPAASAPAAKKAKSSLSLICAGKTLIATAHPAKGSKVSSVWFYVNGKVRAKDSRAPFLAAIPTKGLQLPLTTTAAIQISGTSTFLRKQFRGC